MPLSPALMSISQGLLLLNFLAEEKLKDRMIRVFTDKVFLAVISFFLLYLVGMIYTTDLNQGIQEIKIKLPLLILPIALSNKLVLTKSDFYKVLLAAIAGVFITSIIGMYIYIFDNPENIRAISPFISHIRLSLMICMAVFSAIYLIANCKKSQIIFKILLILIALWLLLFIGILGARAGYLVVLIVAFFVGFSYIIKLKKYVLGIGLAIILFTVPVLMYQLVKSVQIRIDEIPSEYKSYKAGENVSGKSIAQRFVYWDISLQLIKENPIFGVGTGDLNAAFKNYYSEHEGMINKEFQFTSHMQYLNMTVSFGIMGLLIFLLSIFYPTIQQNKISDYLMISFLFTLFISMLTEDTLETQAGATFFAFYFSFLLFAKPKESSISDSL